MTGPQQTPTHELREDPDWLFDPESGWLYGPDPDHPRIRRPFAFGLDGDQGAALAAALNCYGAQRARERATAEVSDVDGLRETLADALRGKQWVRKVMDDGHTSLLQADEFDLADAVLPVVTDWAEQRARERAAEELRAAADWLSTGAAGRPGPLRMIARKLHDRADDLTTTDRTGQPQEDPDA